MGKRVLGATIPLFSIRTRNSWGIGSIADMAPCAAWLKTAGIGLLQILPAYEVASGETSPYGARTAFGLDPLYIDVGALDDLPPDEREAVLGDEGRAELARLRGTDRVDYPAVRALKTRVLAAAFARFHDRDWTKDTPRAKALRTFIDQAKAWEDDLALYVALRESHGEYGWETWPDGEKNRDPKALAEAKKKHARRVLEHQWTQWVANEQWKKARADLRALGVELMGDMPFVVGTESADVWAHADQFRRDLSLGAPPDAFSEDGQDWGLPPYDWDAMDKTDLAWLRARAKRAGELFDRFRIDHAVGFFRMFVKDKADSEKKGWFIPDDEDAQNARGRRVFEAMKKEAAPSLVIAEDLGSIPAFVRATLSELHVPGYRVIPWERDYELHVYKKPEEFPAGSVASWSTHDTAPINAWWGALEDYEKEGLGEMIGVPATGSDRDRWGGIMKTLATAKSDLALLLVAELLGDPGRINTPGTVGPENWSWRLPQPIEDLETNDEVRGRMNELRSFAEAAGRAG